MAKPELEKRPLAFQSLDDVVAEANSLMASGYVSRGNWNLSQTCLHLSDWMRYPIDGFPTPPPLVRAVMWVMKVTVAKRMAAKILSEGFKGGMPTAPVTVYPADAKTDSQAVEQLKATIERIRNHQGGFLASPLFGRQDFSKLEKITLLHAAHHLGYLAPKK